MQEGFEFVVLNPGLLVGPAYSGNDFTSGDILGRALRNEILGIPTISFGFVDARDAAEAHYKAMITEGISGNRYIINEAFYSFGQIIEILRGEFEQYGYNLVKRKVNKCTYIFASIFMKDLRLFNNFLEKDLYTNNVRSVRELGMTYRNVSGSFLEMAHSMIRHGLIPDRVNDKGAAAMKPKLQCLICCIVYFQVVLPFLVLHLHPVRE
eukprot:TRINITY_DN1221_c0_g1_i11.p1 TRINITY_DN1221_c0_g1~~TRINITY_DN1221_c0_g1_i11.p1  ORF type:complete len:209 (+),score=18.20 TRINITY_DN1221_c0_g1_i11:574-1200(+)